jgi:hypothetical protein
MKMQRRQLLLALLSLTFLLAGCCKPGIIGSLPVELRSQETSMWCWAASGEMVMDYLGTNVTQCDEANKRFGRTDCPCGQCGDNPLANPPCVYGGWPEFDKYGFTFERTSDTALSWSSLTKELSPNKYCGKTPIAFSWHWDGGGGHMMVAYGYASVAGVNYVAIHDPWAPCVGDTRLVSYADWVDGAGYSHWDDFYKIRK